jgi:hypothetical protein
VSKVKKGRYSGIWVNSEFHQDQICMPRQKREKRGRRLKGKRENCLEMPLAGITF